jgi:hypothetical protein
MEGSGFLERLRKIKKNPQDSQSLSRHLNLGHREYQSGGVNHSLYKHYIA